MIKIKKKIITKIKKKRIQFYINNNMRNPTPKNNYYDNNNFNNQNLPHKEIMI